MPCETDAEIEALISMTASVFAVQPMLSVDGAAGLMHSYSAILFREVARLTGSIERAEEAEAELRKRIKRPAMSSAAVLDSFPPLH